MGSHKTLSSETENNLKIQEDFQKWFQEIEPKLFQDISPTDDEEDDEDKFEEHKRGIERVKKYMTVFSDSDILLELAEDERNDTNFVCENNPLEAFAVLGALAFFNSYVNPAEPASLNSVNTFLQKYKVAKGVNQNEYLDGMNYVLETFKRGHSSQEGGESQGNENNAVILGIKLHFLQGFRDSMMLTRIRQVLDNILQTDTATTNPGCYLQQYYIQRLFRLEKYAQTKELNNCKPRYEEVMQESIPLEAALRISSQNAVHHGPSPRLLLAKCEFLCDFLICANGPSHLEFRDEKFATHTEIVKFIRNCAESITKEHPSFLRANFTFAEIFANELPITKQDREFAKLLLIKALDANPTSSKILHKMGLFLIKSRQFSEAANYLQRAGQLDSINNAYAYQSLVKLLLRDPATNKARLEDFFNIEYPQIVKTLGSENELGFWKGIYFFKMGETEPAINAWTETILQFYVTKPELDLETVLPFKSLSNVSKQFLWTKSNLTLEAMTDAVKNACSQEKSKRRVVFHRLQDLVVDAMKS